MTRDAFSREAKQLASIQGVTIFEGSPHDEAALWKAFEGVSYVFANTNGFAIGEKAETYWGIRLYEIARGSGVKHFLYAGLEYASRLGGFDPKFRCGHLDGKGKVVDYLKSQPTSPMGWSVLTSCLYVEGLSEVLRPVSDESGTYVFSVPLGDARCPLVYLEDYGAYARWLLDTPTKSNGLELHVAIEDIAWKELAKVFTEVTGKKAVYKDVSLDEYFEYGPFSAAPDALIGSSGSPGEATLQSYRQNFSGFWNTWKAELTARDYDLLDKILPGRVKSVKEWMVLTGYTGEPKSVLKDYRDGTQ